MKRLTLVVTAAALLSGCAILKGSGDSDKQKRTPVVGERLPVLVYEASAEADPELADVTIVLPPAQTNADWTQPGGNAAKNLGHLTISNSLERAWSVSIGNGGGKKAQLAAGPIVAAGKVFTIDAQAEVRAFDAQSGRLIWRASIPSGGESRAAAFGGGVSFGSDRIYATSGWGQIVAFDAATGKQIWKTSLSAPLRGAPAVEGDRLVVITQDNQLVALSATDGKTLWESANTSEASGLFGAATPAIALDTVVAGFSSGDLTALRIENSRPVWQDTLARTGISTAVAHLSDIDASPAIDQGRVFAIGQGGRMAAVELSTGQRVWEVNIAGISTPWVAGDWIYVVTSDSRLLCLSRGTGKVRWATQLPAYKNTKSKKDPIRWTGPVLASEGLFLVGTNGQMISVSPYDGKIASRTKMSDGSHLGPAIANNTIYVVTDDGKLSAWR